jgi:DNA-binding NtrC family response regulator
VFWITTEDKRPLVKEVEQQTNMVATVAQGDPWQWKKSIEQARIVVLCLPLDTETMRQALAVAQGTARRVPVIALDPNRILDESLVLPPMTRFHHVTSRDVNEVSRRILMTAIPFGLNKSELAIDTELRNQLVGESRPMEELRALIRLVGPRNSTILITGETGTGKELVARAIHAVSPRASAEMVAVNCGALPENLIESELFGHTKGAFTGAIGPRVGRFEQAHKGTLFLDEVGEMPLGLQVRLLRVLQERELQRVGSSDTSKIDVRVIAASNRRLVDEVSAGRFREDLYYRLNVIPIHVPALRDRRSDIAALAEHFVDRVCLREGVPGKRFSDEATRRLVEYSWPGNVRQLENYVEKAVALSGSRETLYAGDIVLPNAPAIPAAGDPFAIARREAPEDSLPSSSLNFEEIIARVERMILSKALDSCGGNKARAASLLGMKRTTLLYKMKSIDDRGLVA